MRSPWHLVVGFAWSLPLWVSIALGIWLTSRAFDLTFPFVGSFLVVGLPGRRGGRCRRRAGPVGFTTSISWRVTQFFGAAETCGRRGGHRAARRSFVPVTLLGLVFMWQDGLTLGRSEGA